MASWAFCLFVFNLLFISNAVAEFGMKTSENYGPYIVQWKNTTLCRGPKSTNVTSFETSLSEEPDGSFTYRSNITFLENVEVEEIRISVNTLKEGKKSILWNVNVKKPCQHYMLAPMLEAYVNMKSCWIKKGHQVVVMPLTELLVKYIGNSFFYGDYLFKVVVNSKKANIVCLIFDPMFKKKTKTH